MTQYTKEEAEAYEGALNLKYPIPLAYAAHKLFGMGAGCGMTYGDIRLDLIVNNTTEK